MVTPVRHDGLILAPSSRPSAALDELAACCDWPVVLGANPRRVMAATESWCRESLACLLFWLQDQRDVAPTVELVRWSCQRDGRLFRIALAYRLGEDVERAVRTAGAHVYLSASENLGTVAQEAILPLMNGRREHAARAPLLMNGRQGSGRGPPSRSPPWIAS